MVSWSVSVVDRIGIERHGPKLVDNEQVRSRLVKVKFLSCKLETAIKSLETVLSTLSSAGGKARDAATVTADNDRNHSELNDYHHTRAVRTENNLNDGGGVIGSVATSTVDDDDDGDDDDDEGDDDFLVGGMATATEEVPISMPTVIRIPSRNDEAWGINMYLDAYSDRFSPAERPALFERLDREARKAREAAREERWRRQGLSARDRDDLPEMPDSLFRETSSE